MSRGTMHAVQYNKFGGGASALKHVKIPIPTVKKNDILLKLEAASINPVDWKIQEGAFRLFVPLKFPFVPATNVAGEVIEVGSGVTEFKPGDKVVSLLNFLKGGALAEYAVGMVSMTVHRPPEVSAADAAGLPIAAVTALQALRSAGIKLDATSNPSSNILITAASGGVGHYAVQLAKLGGAHVTATCGARNVELVKSLGADEVLDYKTPEGSSLISPSGKKYDAVIHCTTGIEWPVFETNLSPDGKVIDVTPTIGVIFCYALKLLTFQKKKLVPISMLPKKKDLDFLVDLLKEGKVKTLVDSRHHLSKAEEAWAKCMDGHATGKVIVEM